MTDKDKDNSVASQLLSKGAEKTESAQDEQEFQEYTSARSSTRLITESGFRITFTNFQYLTQNEEAIAYLDEQIKLGLAGITKGKVLTTSDLNPMEALRKTMEAEIRAKIAEEAKNEALGITKDMGVTGGAPSISPASSKAVAKQLYIKYFLSRGT